MDEFSLQNALVHDVRMDAIDWVVDAVVAAGAFGFGCLQLTLAVNLLIPDEMMRRMLGIEAVSPTAYAIAAVALSTVPLVLRRRFPWPVFAVVLLLWMFFQTQMNSVSLSLVGPLVALFTIAYSCTLTETLIAAAAAIAALLIVPTAASSPTLSSLTLVQNVAFMAAAALAGYALQVRQDYVRAVEARAAQAERTRESEAQRRVEAERVRIAREVHDITAHSLSAVSIQAAAAERLVDADPQAAKEAIATARQTAKSALEDMRAMIGVLRSGREAAETVPTEGTDRMGDLAAYLEGAGVACALDLAAYDRSAVPAHIDVALFGIAREACTNIVRHAGASHARVTLSVSRLPLPGVLMGAASSFGFARGEGKARAFSRGSVQLTVEDDGCGFDYDPSAVSGHGLEGMRERAYVLGGSFSVGRSAEGGFAVRVVVPLVAEEGEGDV